MLSINTNRNFSKYPIQFILYYININKSLRPLCNCNIKVKNNTVTISERLNFTHKFVHDNVL